MAQEEVTTVKGVLLDEAVVLTLTEICTACTVEIAFVVELVNEGVLEPIGESPDEWRFSGAELRRMTLATRLSRDLGLNPPGIALSLQLLEEIRELRARLAGRRS